MNHVFGVQPFLNQNKKNVHINNSCPVCSNSNISLNPLAKDEAYELHVRSKGGLEMRFSKAKAKAKANKL